MTEKIEPFFNLSVPDWEYLAAITAGGLDLFGNEVDFLTIIYKDCTIKAKTRIRFPSGNKVSYDKEYASFMEAVLHTKEVIAKFPGFEGISPEVVLNTTTKGQDLLDAMFKNMNIEMKITRLE